MLRNPCQAFRFFAKALGWIIAVIVSAPGVGCAEMAILSVQKHFEWGEYDSLLVKIPSILKGEGDLSGRQYAMLHTFLGVTHFMQGDTQKAAAEYRQGFQADAGVTLDSQYVSGQVMDHYLAVRTDWSMKLAENSESTVGISQNAHSATAPKYWAAGSLAAGGALGILAFGQYRASEDAWKDQQMAGAIADTASYHKHGEAVRTAEVMALAFGMGSALGVVAGVYFLTKWKKESSPVASNPRENEGSKFKFSFAPRTAVTWDYRF